MEGWGWRYPTPRATQHRHKHVSLAVKDRQVRFWFSTQLRGGFEAGQGGSRVEDFEGVTME